MQTRCGISLKQKGYTYGAQTYIWSVYGITCHSQRYPWYISKHWPEYIPGISLVYAKKQKLRLINGVKIPDAYTGISWDKSQVGLSRVSRYKLDYGRVSFFQMAARALVRRLTARAKVFSQHNGPARPPPGCQCPAAHHTGPSPGIHGHGPCLTPGLRVSEPP